MRPINKSLGFDGHAREYRVKSLKMHRITSVRSFDTRRPRGQGLVEFSLILPLLLLAIVSIVEFGRLMFTISSVASASRDAARYGSSVGTDAFGIAHYQDCIGIRETVRRLSFFVELDIVIEFDEDGPGGVLPVEYCQPGLNADPTVVAILGSQIVVEVTGNYRSLVLAGLFKLPPIPVLLENRRTILRDIFID
jgi:hypothetical protein